MHSRPETLTSVSFSPALASQATSSLSLMASDRLDVPAMAIVAVVLVKPRR